MASLDELRADLLRRLAEFLPMEESSAAATSSLSTTSSTKRTAAAPLAPIATTTPKLVSDPVLEQQMTKPSSSLVFSAGQVVGDGGPHADAVFASALPTRCSTMCLDVNGHSDCAVDAFPSMDNTRPEVAAPTELTYGCVNATSSTDAVVPAKCSTVGLDPNIGAVEVGDSYQQSGIVSTVNPGLVGAPDQPGLHLARPPPWPVWMASVPSTASPTFRFCKGVQTETRTFQSLIPDMAEIADEDSSTSIDLICALCDNGGEIASCEGKCLRSFHATKDAGEDCKTLGDTRAQFDAMKVFLCKNCEHERYQCFAGHRLGSAKTDPPEVFPCASANCGHFYHATCVAQLLFPQNDAKATEYTTKIINGSKFACSVHSCHICTYAENKEVTEQQINGALPVTIPWDPGVCNQLSREELQSALLEHHNSGENTSSGSKNSDLCAAWVTGENFLAKPSSDFVSFCDDSSGDLVMLSISFPWDPGVFNELGTTMLQSELVKQQTSGQLLITTYHYDYVASCFFTYVVCSNFRRFGMEATCVVCVHLPHLSALAWSSVENMLTKLSAPSETLPNSEAALLLQDRQAQLDRLKIHLAAAQNRMKMQAGKRRTERTFVVGEQVLLKLQPYTQSSMVNRPCPKLAFKFFGPFRVLEKVGLVAYRPELPAHSSIHPVFHVSQIKGYTPDFTPVFTELPHIPALDMEDTEPEEILDHRLVTKGNAAIPQVLVKWKGIPATSATCEDMYVCKHRFTDAVAWGQATSPGGGDVTATAVQDNVDSG